MVTSTEMSLLNETLLSDFALFYHASYHTCTHKWIHECVHHIADHLLANK